MPIISFHRQAVTMSTGTMTNMPARIGRNNPLR